MVENAPDGRTGEFGSAPFLGGVRSWWRDLDRGWRASLIGLLAVVAVLVA